MQTDIFPHQDLNLNLWLANFSNQAKDHAAELDLSEEQIDALLELSQEFAEAMRQLEAARSAALAATALKNEVRAKAAEAFRNAARLVSANAEIAPEVKGALGLKVTPLSYGPVRIPNHLSVVPHVTGQNTLKWSRNGNSRTTTFVVEANDGDGNGWRMVEVCTRTSFVHSGQAVGKPVSYRVYATRAGQRSVPSMAVTAYAATTDLRLAASA